MLIKNNRPLQFSSRPNRARPGAPSKASENTATDTFVPTQSSAKPKRWLRAATEVGLAVATVPFAALSIAVLAAGGVVSGSARSVTNNAKAVYNLASGKNYLDGNVSKFLSKQTGKVDGETTTTLKSLASQGRAVERHLTRTSRVDAFAAGAFGVTAAVACLTAAPLTGAIGAYLAGSAGLKFLEKRAKRSQLRKEVRRIDQFLNTQSSLHRHSQTGPLAIIP